MSEPVKKEMRPAQLSGGEQESVKEGGSVKTPPTFQLSAGPQAPPNGGGAPVAQRQVAQGGGGGGAGAGLPAEWLAHLRLREGDRSDVYNDSRGFPTSGVGHLLTAAERAQYRVGSIVPQAVRDAWLDADARGAYNAGRAQAGQVGVTSPAFINALASVNFQLGTAWNTEHRRTWAFMQAGQWESAATEAQDSSWYTQTPVRVRDFQAALRALVAGGTNAGAAVAGNGNAVAVANGSVTGDDVNVRSGPGRNHNAVETLDRGARVQVFETQNGWVRIGNGRWMSAEFVRQTPIDSTVPATPRPPVVAPTPQPRPVVVAPTPVPVTAAPVQSGVITGDDVNVRSGPGLSNAVVGQQLDKNAQITIYERRDGWVRIGQGRWVSAQFVRQNSAPATSGESNTPAPRPQTPAPVNVPQTPAPVGEAPALRSVTISGSVGAGAANSRADVLKIQQLLKDLGYRIGVDGGVGKNTVGAIASFQEGKGIGSDGRVDPGGTTLRLMNSTPNGAFKNTTAHLRDDPDAPRLTHSKWTNKGHLTVDTSDEVIPQQHYANMNRLIQMMNAIGDNLRGTFTVGSGYRSPYYNSTLEGSAAQSNHQFGRAVDIYASDYTPSQLKAQLRRLINEGKIHNGGIGLYSWGCHYDIDTAREWNG
jgi:uncharacterized protein YgiM (DUF1202 family)